MEQLQKNSRFGLGCFLWALIFFVLGCCFFWLAGNLLLLVENLLLLADDFAVDFETIANSRVYTKKSVLQIPFCLFRRYIVYLFMDFISLEYFLCLRPRIFMKMVSGKMIFLYRPQLINSKKCLCYDDICLFQRKVT